jgi:hypothetical protein
VRVPADQLSVVQAPPVRRFAFTDAWADGAAAFTAGLGLEESPLRDPLLCAWWRRGWRSAAREAALAASDDAERNEVDPCFDWEGARC